MPLSVLIPAPVNATARSASTNQPDTSLTDSTKRLSSDMFRGTPREKVLFRRPSETTATAVPAPIPPPRSRLPACASGLRAYDYRKSLPAEKARQGSPRGKRAGGALHKPVRPIGTRRRESANIVCAFKPTNVLKLPYFGSDGEPSSLRSSRKSGSVRIGFKAESLLSVCTNCGRNSRPATFAACRISLIA